MGNLKTDSKKVLNKQKLLASFGIAIGVLIAMGLGSALSGVPNLMQGMPTLSAGGTA